MRPRRQPGRLAPGLRGVLAAGDRGAFTAELAAGLPALMLLLFAGLTAVGAMTAQGRSEDAAREGAIAAARGTPGAAETAARIAGPAARIDTTETADTVTVTVRVPVPILGGHLPMITVRAEAVAAREPVSSP
ncbi:TadE family type IV pilus minor pilin [Actinoplanes sp. NPDC051859]|uniref:TadE family type IV pilus minor pilin n=1 Tax=Actinoplanes sp. NPDC051859 TaxID=3363909 RepID=UPI0037946E2F